MGEGRSKYLIYTVLCGLSGFSCVRLFAIPWTVAHQPPLSKGFSRQEYWSGLPWLSPGDVPDPRIEPASLCHFGSPDEHQLV